MSFRAKMKIESKEPVVGGEGFTVVARPVVGGSPENDSFYKWTPGGQLTLSTINDAVASQLEVGQEVYLDVTPIPMAGQAAPPQDPHADLSSGGAAVP
jgi:hypothetical protein